MPRRGNLGNWQGLPAGKVGYSYSCWFGKSGLCCEIYFDSPDPDLNSTRFAAAHAKQAQLETAYGARLSFEPLPERKGCRIGVYRPGSIEEIEEWEAYIEWFIDAQGRLRAAIDAVGGLAAFDPSAISGHDEVPSALSE